MKKLILLFILIPLTTCLAQQPGSFDTTFNVGIGPQYVIYSGGDSYLNDALIRHSALLPDGKIIVIGQFKYFDGNSTSKIARLNADGSFDNTFNSSGTGFDSNLPWNSEAGPREIIAQPDGKILVSGNFKSYNGILKRLLIRLNSDGSIDDSFYFYNTPLYDYSYHNSISDVYVMSNGKILVAGTFGYYNNTNLTIKNQLLRLNSDGSLDTTFNIQNSYDGYIADIKLQADDKILVAGQFDNISSFWYPKIARLNSDGTVDTTFIIYAGFNNSVKNIEIAPDGGIYVGGPFTTFDNAPVQHIIKLLPGGYRDFTFTIGAPEITPPFGDDYFILMPNGQLFLFGSFIFNGNWNYNAGMFNADGSFDYSFLNVFENYVSGFAQPDGKIVCYGSFNSYDGHTAKRIVRINGPSLATNDFDQIKATVFPNPSSSEIHLTGFQEGDLIDLIIITDMTGKEIVRRVDMPNKINVENLASGMYLLQAFSNSIKTTTKFIKN